MTEETEHIARDFYGNQQIIARLERKQNAGRLPHSSIFSGPRGIGKRTYAMRLAKTLNCTSPSVTPCNDCMNCRRITIGAHPDVFSILVGDDASQIKIEQVRALLSKLDLNPLEGKVKVYIIDPAEGMSAGAANALLKALEEPPSNTYFFLITENVQSLLPTVRSRCQLYNFAPLKRDEIRSYGIQDELVVRWANGSIGRALSFDAHQLRTLRDLIYHFLATAVQASDVDLAALLTNADVLSRSKEDYDERLGTLTVLVADLIHLQEGLDDRLVNVDIEPDLRRLSAKTSTEHLIQIADWLKFMELNTKYHLNKQLMSDFLLLNLNEHTSKLLNKRVLT